MSSGQLSYLIELALPAFVSICCMFKNHIILDQYKWKGSMKSAYLSNIEQQCDGIVEVWVGTASIDPEMPEHREEHWACQQNAGNQEDVPQNLRKKKNLPVYNGWNTLAHKDFFFCTCQKTNLFHSTDSKVLCVTHCSWTNCSATKAKSDRINSNARFHLIWTRSC